MADRQAGGRWVEVPPERLVRWVENFTLRHGPAVAEPGSACADTANCAAVIFAPGLTA